MEQQQSQPQQVPVMIDEVINRLNVLAMNTDIEYKQDEQNIKCVYKEGEWQGKFSLPELFNALEDVYSEEQMKLIALGGEEGTAR